MSFCINKDDLDVNGLFPFHLVFYELEIICFKMVKKSTIVCGKDRRYYITHRYYKYASYFLCTLLNVVTVPNVVITTIRVATALISIASLY